MLEPRHNKTGCRQRLARPINKGGPAWLTSIFERPAVMSG